MTTIYIFSGHESFSCKQLWLKKGCDFLVDGNNFNDPNSVVKLGVGKNMVSSIRYWLRSFKMTVNDELTPMAHYIFNDDNGKDPFIEDLGTLWLLHFLLVYSGEATLYDWLFIRLQKERKEFTRSQVVNTVRRYMIEAGKAKAFNENTVKKDVGVLLQNYVQPVKAHTFEEYTSLLLDLELIRTPDEGKTYQFNFEGKRKLPVEIYVYAVLTWMGGDKSISFSSLQELSLIFCMSDMETIEMLQKASDMFPENLHYSDVAGVRQLQITKDIAPKSVLDKYYQNEEN